MINQYYMPRFCSTLLLVFTLQMAIGQTWTTTLDSVLTVLADDELYHGQVLIAEQGQIVFHKAYGNLPDQQTPITTTRSLAVKSVTKAFTAAAVLHLEQQGKLSLSDEVGTYFPDWPYRGITIRQLLSMTSGLPSFIEKAVNEGDTTQWMRNADIVRFVSKYKVLVNPPGAAYNYQNSNFIVLAALVEQISGVPFEDYVYRVVLQPLGLEHTFFQDLTTITKGVDGDSFYAPSGDGNLYSTAADLYRFEQAFYDNEILSEENKQKTFTKTTLTDGTLSKYGLAWWVIDDGPEMEYYIIGDGPNIRASIQRYPERNSTLIYIHNFSGRYWKDVYWTVRNIWLGQDYTMPEKQQELIEYDIDTKLYDQYVGSYLTPGFGLLHITEEDGKLYLRPHPIPGKEELVPSSDTTFYFRDQSVEWEFFLDEEGAVIGFGSRGNPESMGEKQ